MADFAPDYPRNENGWIVFPNDKFDKWRQSLFPPKTMKHYAKMQMHVEWELIKYVSKPGDTIMDPMSGTGTVMLAAIMERNVICIEIEEPYHLLQQEVLEHLRLDNELSNVTLIHGNCRLVLPLPCNHIIFSPPYAQALKPSKNVSGFVKDKYQVGTETDGEDWYHAYAQTTGNVGLINTFLYHQAMESVYKLCYQSLPVGGTLSVVTKDITEKGKRVLLTKRIEKVCVSLGFTLDSWHKHAVLGGPYQDMRRVRGDETVDDEDIMIWRK